ncbi:phage tail tape measure protein [Micromonospora aurantiaca (nom. illeg.)]|uniref:phage tail tape measure protein n=1 Tax=Micromonospora aurantiaca (nom. illeg.) TaxID=47850 RepID=UPI0033FE0AA8
MGKTLADGYLELRADASKLGPDVRKGIKAINADKAGAEAGEGFATRFSGAAKEKLSAGLGATLGVLGIGAGIGGALTSGITGALDVGAANDKLRAQLNLSAEQSGRIGKVAGELYASNYGESMGEVNDAIARVVQAVPSLRNASLPVLKDIAAGALDIARVFDQDVGGVTAAVSSMLRSGLAPNAQAAMDILTKGFQSGADKGQDLLDTFTEYSGQFRKLGLDAPTSLGIINQLLAGGARNADLAADAVKEFSIRSIDGSKTSADGYKLLGLNAKEFTKRIAEGGPAAKTAFSTVVERLNAMENPVKRNAAGVALFGTQWEDLGDAFKRLDVSAATDGLGKVAGATKGIADQSDQARLQSFIRTVQQGFVNVIGGQVIPAVQRFAAENRDKLTAGLNAAKQAGESLLPTVRSFGQFLVGTVVPALADTGRAIGSATGWLREHETTTKILVGTLGGAVIAVKGYQAAVVVAGAATTAWSVVTRGAAAVQAGYNAVLALGNSTLAVWVGVKALEFAAWIRSTAAVVASTAATVAATVATNAVRVATLVWTGVQWALNAALTANPIGLVVAAIVALIAIVVLAYKKNETFRNVVQSVWSGIKAAIGAVVSWWTGTAWPFIKRGIDILVAGFQLYWSIVKQVWSGVFSAISLYWRFIRDKVFEPLKNFVTKTIPDAFRSGTATIGRIWSGLQDLAKKPVRFVVDTVINGAIIGTFNKVSGFFGGPKLPQVALPKGFGDGHGHGPARPPAGPGTGDGVGSMLGLFRGPAKWVRSRVMGKVDDIVSRFGNNPYAQMLRGTGGKLLGGLVAKVTSLVNVSDISSGGSAGAGGLRSGILGVLGALRGVFGSVPIISGLRPGSTTLSGNRSYHASGRAIDIAPVRAWAEFLAGRFGGQLRELITPWRDLNMLNGRPHRYSRAIEAQHGVFGNNAHIHAAMDDGGRRWLRPGLNIIPNGTGAREPIYGPAEIGEVVELLRVLIAAVREIVPGFGSELRGSRRGAMAMARSGG